MSQSTFEQYLKNSDYFRDVINTHRRATADALATIIEVLVDQNQVTNPVIDQALKGLDERTDGSISVRSERRLVTAMIRDALKR